MYFTILYIVLFSLLFPVTNLTRSTSYLKCIQVENNSSARLFWDQPVDYADFDHQEIYHATSFAGPYTIINDNNDFAVTSFLHAGINTTGTRNYYYIRTYTNTSGEITSDTLGTIRLTVAGISNNSIARLDWNAISNGMQYFKADGWFYIQKKYSSGGWFLADSTQSVTYSDTIGICYDTINYMIQYDGSGTCLSVSNVSGWWLQDLTKPPIPVMDSVSIDPGGKVGIGWQQNPDPGTVAYIIYRKMPTSWISIDTVWGIGNTSYSDVTVDPCSHRYSYSIAAIDSCGNTSAFGINPRQPGDSLRSILLKKIVYDPCQNSSTLNWTPYINMRGGHGGYNIYFRKFPDNFQLLDHVDSGVTQYIHNSPENNSTYDYFVQAVNVAGTLSSSSCNRPITTWYPPLPAFIYLRKATVEDNSYVSLTFFVDTSAVSQGFRILRSVDISGPFDLLGTVMPDNKEILRYEDHTADIGGSGYYYMVVATDSCGRDGLESNQGRTIFLEIQNMDTDNITLAWNEYEDWDSPVEKYDIYRILSDGDSELMTHVGPGNTTLQFIAADGDRGYFVAAVESTGGIYPFSDTSRSNMVILEREPEIYMPNAFKPGGTSQVFKPVAKYIEATGYRFMIFSRSGHKIFETGDPGEGWNGSYNGSLVQAGAYVYLVSYRNGPYKIEKKGQVTVLY